MVNKNNDDYLGQYMTECPNCGHRYNKKLHGNKCPDCGYKKNSGRYLIYIVFIILFVFLVLGNVINLDFENIETIVKSVDIFNFINPVYILIAINVILYIFGFNSANSNKFGNSYYDTIYLREHYRLITSGFAHADLLHLICNMYSLYNLGMFMYARVGTLLFLILYFVSMVLGGLISTYLHHNSGNDHIKSIGASGAICGLLGFYIIFLCIYNRNPIQAVENIYRTVIPLGITAFNPRIDNLGHLSGLAVGLVLSFILLNTFNYSNPNTNNNSTILTSKRTEKVVEVIIYEPNTIDNIIKDKLYIENETVLDNAINECREKVANQINTQINAEQLTIHSSVLEKIIYGNINIDITKNKILSESELIDYLLYGNNGQPIVTFIDECSYYSNGEYFEKVFYNGVEQ